MEKNFSKEYQCPVCALKAWIIKAMKLTVPLPDDTPFFGELAQELKDRGIARPEWVFCLDVKQGVAVDPAKEQSIPIGSEMPAYYYETDACMECGCIYAKKLVRGSAKKGIQPAPQKPLPKMDIPGLNDPRFS